MIFQDSPVIVENGQTTARIDVKVVGCARMVEIVDNGCHQGREDFQVRHPILKPQRRTQKIIKAQKMSNLNFRAKNIIIFSFNAQTVKQF